MPGQGSESVSVWIGHYPIHIRIYHNSSFSFMYFPAMVSPSCVATFHLQPFSVNIGLFYQQNFFVKLLAAQKRFLSKDTFPLSQREMLFLVFTPQRYLKHNEFPNDVLERGVTFSLAFFECKCILTVSWMTILNIAPSLIMWPPSCDYFTFSRQDWEQV